MLIDDSKREIINTNEMCLLSFAISDEKTAKDIFANITPNDFYYPKHQKIANAIIDIQSKDGNVDIIQIALKLKDSKDLVEIGGEQYLSKILEYSIKAYNYKWYLKEIKTLSLERQKEEIANRIKQIEDNEEDINKLVKIQKQIDDIDYKRITLEDYSVSLENDVFKDREIIRTGFSGIDESSMAGGDLVVIAARPGVGKSILAANMLNRFLKDGLKCLVFTTEMTQEQYMLRQLSIYADLYFYGIRNGFASDEQKKAFMAANKSFTQRYKDLLFYSNNLRPSSSDIVQELEEIKPKVFILDNMSSIKLTSKMKNKTDMIGEYLEEIKECIVKNKILAIIICHINREADMTNEKKPYLNNLKDSSKIEELANKVITLWPNDKIEVIPKRKYINWEYAKDRDGLGGYGVLGIDTETLYMASVNFEGGEYGN